MTSRIELRSDTKTRPTAGMRAAMADAIVGDEQAGEDPTTEQLCRRVAELLGKEAAIFLPSGTMCNHIAILIHCQPGDEIIAADVAHIISSESAGASALAGTQILALPTTRGIFSDLQVSAVLRSPTKRNAPRSRLICIEQTVNRGAGAIWPVIEIEKLAALAGRTNLRVHMDGARLLNASAASGMPASRYAAPCDSVWIDLTKGLGCPVGAVLAGSGEFISAAWRWKHRLGGAMRQSGILAAAGLYALDHHVERLAADHTSAKRFAEAIRQIPGVSVKPDVIETNIVLFDISGSGWRAPELSEALRARGIDINADNNSRLRAVTHLDVTLEQVEEAAHAVRTVLSSRPIEA